MGVSHCLRPFVVGTLRIGNRRRGKGQDRNRMVPRLLCHPFRADSRRRNVPATIPSIPRKKMRIKFHSRRNAGRQMVETRGLTTERAGGTGSRFRMRKGQCPTRPDSQSVLISSSPSTRDQAAMKSIRPLMFRYLSPFFGRHSFFATRLFPIWA